VINNASSRQAGPSGGHLPLRQPANTGAAPLVLPVRQPGPQRSRVRQPDLMIQYALLPLSALVLGAGGWGTLSDREASQTRAALCTCSARPASGRSGVQRVFRW